jgi:hypothetical protein
MIFIIIIIIIIIIIKCGTAKFISVDNYVAVPVAARYKACVCGRSLAGIACSNPTVGGECCVLSGTDLGDEPITRPEESYRV